MKRRTIIALLGVATALAGCASTMTDPASAPASDPAASVSFIEPLDGATVSGPFKVKFAVSGMRVRTAGDMTPMTGHFHLLINKGPKQTGASIGFLDEQEIHFSQGQTEAQLFLLPGAHKLTVQFADGAHHSYGPRLSHTISITAK